MVTQMYFPGDPAARPSTRSTRRSPDQKGARPTGGQLRPRRQHPRMGYRLPVGHRPDRGSAHPDREPRPREPTTDATLLPATPGQTVGPFFGYALPFDRCNELVPPGSPNAVQLHGVVADADGRGVPDALLEIWQADADGTIPNATGSLHRDGWTFTGWGRASTDDSWPVQLLHRHSRCHRTRCGAVHSDHRVRQGAAEPVVHPRLRTRRATGRRSAAEHAARPSVVTRSSPLATKPVYASTSNCRTRRTSPRRSSCVTRATSDDRPVLARRRSRWRPDERRARSWRPWSRWNGAWLDGLVDAGIAPREARAQLVDLLAESDLEAIARRADADGNPVSGLVSLLRERSAEPTARWLHRGLTSQDVVDTALMLCARDVLIRDRRRVRHPGTGAVAISPKLTAAHTALARTLTQAALPSTLGAKFARWLTGVLDAAEPLSGAAARRCRFRLAVRWERLAAATELTGSVDGAIALSDGLAARTATGARSAVAYHPLGGHPDR